MHTSIPLRLALFALAAIPALLACSGGDRPAGAGGDAKGAKAGDATARASGVADDGMVSAVSASGKPGASVDLKFDLATKPELGKPLVVTVAVVPRAADIAQLRVVFQSNEAVEVQSGSEMPMQEKPADGVAVSHAVTVVPRREGVLYLGAVALVESGAGSVARSFAIPIIVGDPVQAEQALAAKPAQGALAKGEGGEKIISLPASENP